MQNFSRESCCNYGGFFHVSSDPGSEFNALAFSSLVKLLSADITITWVDGIEPTVKMVKRHLLSLCLQERIIFPPAVQYNLNSRDQISLLVTTLISS